MGFNIEKIGVIGAGQMGSGIAFVCAQSGFDVRLNDVAEERLNAALATTTIVVDPANALQELNKLNNSATRSVVVLAGLAVLLLGEETRRRTLENISH